MTSLLIRLREWLRKRLFRPAVKIAARRSNRPKTAVVNREDEGAFFYLRDVLDRLKQCQKLLRALRRCDPDAYEYHRRVGAKVLPESSMVLATRLWPETLERRPANGMTLLFEKQGADYFPRLFFFLKVKTPVNVQFCFGDTYRCAHIFFMDGKSYGCSFYVAVGKNGELTLLRERGPIRQILPGGNTIKRFDWAHSESLVWCHNRRNECCKDETLEQWAFVHFCICVNWSSMPASDELLVRCKRGNVCAALNISTKRTPYFFQDRETTLAVDGKRKRIFHIVRAHTRDLGDGRLSEVKEHYRGERKFTWGGHKVVISLPKTQGAVNIDVPAYLTDEPDVVEPGMITTAELGKRIARMVEG